MKNNFGIYKVWFLFLVFKIFIKKHAMKKLMIIRKIDNKLISVNLNIIEEQGTHPELSGQGGQETP